MSNDDLPQDLYNVLIKHPEYECIRREENVYEEVFSPVNSGSPKVRPKRPYPPVNSGSPKVTRPKRPFPPIPKGPRPTKPSRVYEEYVPGGGARKTYKRKRTHKKKKKTRRLRRTRK